MKLAGFAALMLAAMPVAAMAAQPEAKAAADKSDVEKPVTRVEISSKLDADFADMDANHDGKVDAAEIDARLVKSAEAKLDAIKKERDAAFARLDVNGDGTITRAEFDEKAKLPTIKQPDAAPFMAEFDANKDGEITLEEFRTPTLANFTRMDINHDGTVTPAEANRAATSAVTQGPTKKPTFKNTPSITR
ncbi:EF-hand domain-containing protein [Sphingomonas sp.]|uniref:EF-hand domain-containing protein n=1 Tax=Sphingomonas sp. TaxID=28214 RepID=UPI0025E50C4A|nr:EF-hand domain-containing protein [Sphingomonas sp.]